MRHIDLEEIKELIPDEWGKKASKAFNAIKELPPEDRIDAINERAEVWQELKPFLDKYSNGKCWYCESSEDRSDNTVDHFRPKGKVIECQNLNHYGYWWLAFKLENFRFSCTFCNSRRKDLSRGTCGGKHNHFPLFDEKLRAEEYDDLEREQPYLLDPADDADPGLLWFNELGEAISKYDKTTRSYKRATKSIELYHLNFYKTKQKRFILYKYIWRLVKDGDRYFNRYIDDNPDKDIDHAFKEVIRNLGGLINKNAEFSAAARVYMRNLQDNGSEWIEIVFQTH